MTDVQMEANPPLYTDVEAVHEIIAEQLERHGQSFYAVRNAALKISEMLASPPSVIGKGDAVGAAVQAFIDACAAHVGHQTEQFASLDADTQEMMCAAIRAALSALPSQGSTICRHEPYDGACVHCGIPFRFGQPFYGDTDATPSQGWVEGIEALRQAAAKFREYERLHAAKLHDGTPTHEWMAVQEKVARNREMAEMCEAALASLTPKETSDG